MALVGTAGECYLLTHAVHKDPESGRKDAAYLILTAVS